MTKPSAFLCVACGADQAAYAQACTVCGRRRAVRSRESRVVLGPLVEESAPAPMQARTEPAPRMRTGLGPLDDSLGGGLALGSTVLLSGPRGSGKSTLGLRMLASVSIVPDEAIYVQTEEGRAQVEDRVTRTFHGALGVPLLCTSSLSRILQHAEACRLVVIDSIHELDGRLEENTRRILRFCKARDVSLVCVAHVVKDGSVRGSAVVEHLFDTRLDLDLEDPANPSSELRRLETVKNRFGPRGVWRLALTPKGWEPPPEGGASVGGKVLEFTSRCARL